MLERCLSGAAGDAALSEAVVHVQEGNEDALRFYQAAGFQVRPADPPFSARAARAPIMVHHVRTAWACCVAAQVKETVKDYYKKLDPPDALLLAKPLQQYVD